MKALSENRRYSIIIGSVILFSCASLIGLNYLSIRILSAITAYSNVESEYSKAQKDASRALVSYLYSANSNYYRTFEREINVPIGDSLARVALRDGKNESKITESFLQGRNQSADIQKMLWLFKNFSKASYFKKMHQEWASADKEIARLHLTGKSIRKENVLNTLTEASRLKYLAKVETLNSSLSKYQHAFAGILGEAFRAVTGLLLYLNITFILVLLVCSGWFLSDLIRQLINSKRLIRHQNHAKDEFMSIASHELKTPITSMKASIQILERRVESVAEFASLKPFVSSANKQISRLTILVNELLDVTRIQSGKLVLDKSITPLHDLVKETVEEMQHISHHIYTIDALPEVYVNADPRRIQQVIVNFLTNAAKFSPGSTNIVVGIEKEADSMKFFVRDYGIGIPQAKIPLIFERFYRVEETGNVVQGLGLGLYICSGIIKNHSGKIGVESVLEQGSTFWFSLPMATVYQQQTTH